jgi:sterol desaturase/sphingolipid hydroxylase (fatty acid hydroxylase superfamily)
MHHADLEFDVTTGVRFHPFELVLSMAIKLSVVVAVGTPPMAALLFEVLLNATSMFNHGNVVLPRKIDGALPSFVVTPEMHRVDHSVVPHEANSKLWFQLPVVGSAFWHVPRAATGWSRGNDDRHQSVPQSARSSV